jgi:ElaB/YqjD/DUF883 family membrane-anchored ribosome-binding protein
MMSESNISAIKIAVLEQKSDAQSRAIDRIDSAIEKIAETNQHILKMLAIHDEKISSKEKSDIYLSKEIEEVRTEAKSYFEETNKTLEKIEEKISDLMKLKWTTIGMATLLLVLIGAVTQLAGGIIQKDDIIRHQQQEQIN